MFLSTSSCIFPHDYEAQAAEKAVAQVHRVAITVAEPPPPLCMVIYAALATPS